MAKERLKSRTPAAGTCQLTRNDPLLNTIDVCSEAPWPFLHRRGDVFQFLKKLQQFLRCSNHRNIYWLYHATVFDLKHRNRNKVEIRSRHDRIHAAIGSRSQGQRNRDCCYQISWLIAIKQLIEKKTKTNKNTNKTYWFFKMLLLRSVSQLIVFITANFVVVLDASTGEWNIYFKKKKYLFPVCREYEKATARATMMNKVDSRGAETWIASRFVVWEMKVTKKNVRGGGGLNFFSSFFSSASLLHD